MTPDPYGIREVGRQAMRDWETNAFRILVELGVLDEGSLAPWYTLEDVIPMYPPRERPYLSPGEVWEDRAPPPATLGRAAAVARDLILE